MNSIPMGTNCALLLSFVFLHAYEPYFLQGFLKLSLNNSRFGDYLHLVNPNELEVMDATDTRKSTSFLNFHIEIDNGGRIKTKLFDKCDDFNNSTKNSAHSKSSKNRRTIHIRFMHPCFVSFRVFSLYQSIEIHTIDYKPVKLTTGFLIILSIK